MTASYVNKSDRMKHRDAGMQKTDSARAEWLRSVLDRYERSLVRYATALTGDLEHARDIVQDTFLRLCSEKDPFRVQDHLAPWLFTVCRNRAFDVRRKENRMRSLDEVNMDASQSSNSSPSAPLEQRQQLSQVLVILESLPKNQREVIRLKFQNEMSYMEISQITNLSVSNVGFLIHTGLKTIRERLRSDATLAQHSLRRVK